MLAPAISDVGINSLGWEVAIWGCSVGATNVGFGQQFIGFGCCSGKLQYWCHNFWMWPATHWAGRFQSGAAMLAPQKVDLGNHSVGFDVTVASVVSGPMI